MPVLSGLTVTSLAPLMGKEVILDGICSVLVVEPNDAVNDYYSVAQRLADRRHQQQIKDAGLPALTRDNVPVEIAANIGSALEAPGRLPAARRVSGCFALKCCIWTETLRRTSRSNSKPISRCCSPRRASRSSFAQWTSAAISGSLT